MWREKDTIYQSLIVLRLKENNIASVDAGIMKALPKIKLLNLEVNSITHFEDPTFYLFGRSWKYTIALSYNPLDCRSHLAWVISARQVVGEATCSTPFCLNGSALHAMSMYLCIHWTHNLTRWCRGKMTATLADDIFKCNIVNENVLICSQASNWQLVIIDPGNGLVPKRRQAIIWTNDDPVQWRLYGSPNLNELTRIVVPYIVLKVLCFNAYWYRVFTHIHYAYTSVLFQWYRAGEQGGILWEILGIG